MFSYCSIQTMNSNLSQNDLWSEALRWIPGGVNSPVRAFRAVGGQPFFVKSAQGATLTTVEEKKLIDYVGTWGPAILGHTPDVVIKTICESARSGVSFGTPHQLEVEMAQTICRMIPSIEKVRMVNSGTEATMSCIRLARGATGRDRIIKFEGCYHGHVDSLLVKAGSGALTFGYPDSAGVPAALAALTITLPFNNLGAVEQAFKKYASEIAAIILEPIPANAGLYIPEPGFLEGLRELCTAHGVLLIFDEVMTGFRLARGGYQERCGIKPDLTALGKVIGGGLPVGAFGGRAELMDQLAPTGRVYQAGTLSGNPLALAAGLAQLRELERVDGWKKLEDLGALLEKEMCEVVKNKPFTFHCIGSMFCLFFHEGPIRNLIDAKKCRTEEFGKFFHGCLERGVFFAPSQFEAGFISLAHTPELIGRTAEVVAEVLEAI